MRSGPCHHVVEGGRVRAERGCDTALPFAGPQPRSADELQAAPEFAGWLFGVVTVDPALLDDTVERVNITLPRRVLARIDAKAKAVGESRSRYIARMALG